MNSLFKIGIITDITEAERLWKIFSPQETIFDDWNFRALFHKYHQHELRFYVGFINDEIIGIMPLQFNKKENYLEFWGGSYMEDNRVMVKNTYENLIPEFYEHIKERVKLQCIRGNDLFTSSLEIQDYKYVLPVDKHVSLEDYLKNSFQTETQKTFNKKIRRIEREQIEITVNDFNDIELMFEYNIATFGDASSFIMRPFHKEIFRDLVKMPDFKVYLKTFKIAGIKQGVSLALGLGNYYEYFITGINPVGVKDLATYINLNNIEQGIKEKYHNVDAFVGNYGWKERWHFEKHPQYKFEKNLSTETV